jgi:hypothetical protein
VASAIVSGFEQAENATAALMIKHCSIVADLAKAATLAPHADAYALVLCTHVLGEIAPQLRRWVVKYSSGIIGAAKSHGHAGQEAARRSLGGELSQLGPSDWREMPSGSV